MNITFKALISFLILIASISHCLWSQDGQEEYISIEVYTGEDVDSGSNISPDLELHGFINNKKVTDWILDITRYIDGNAHERGTVDRFNFLALPFTKLDKITITYDYQRGVKNWYLKKMIIRLANGNTYLFTCNCNFNSQNRQQVLYGIKIDHRNPENDFFDMKVEVLTSDVPKAGTNANVYLTLNADGELGPNFKLNNRISGNAFERNDHDLLVIKDHNVFSQLKSINIRHDNKGSGPGWHLKELRISTPSGKMKTFPCDCWMEGSENGKTLFPKEGVEQAETVYIQSSIDAKYLDVKKGASTNGTPMQIWYKNKSKAQQFKIEPAGQNFYYIKSEVSENKYLHVSAYSKEPKAKVVLWDGKGGDNTKWIIEEHNNSGYYTIRSKMGTYLDVQWGKGENGTPVWMWNGNGGKAQMWRFMKEEDGTLIPKRF